MAPGATRVPLNDVENLAAGSLGGVLETVLQMPLVTYKICKQEGRAFPKGLGWYRGVVANAGSLAPITAVQMMANGVLERAVLGGQARKMTGGETIGCAMGAGAISAYLYGPLDLVVIHQQKLKLGPAETIKAIAKEHGGLMLWRGISSTIVREAIYTAGYLGLAPICKEQLQKVSPWMQERDLTASIVGSCIGGTVSALLTHPVDTAKTMLQADLKGTKYKSATQAMKEVFETEGIGGLYKGGGARTLRLCGAFFVISNVREYAIQYKNSK